MESNKKPTIDDMCKAIEAYEGYFAPGEDPRYPNGTPAWRNRNPGNLRYALQGGAIGQKDGFAVFPSYEVGYKALYSQIRLAVRGFSRVYMPRMTLVDFFNVYAPSSDDNHPDKYAEFVAKRLGVDKTFRIGDLVV